MRLDLVYGESGSGKTTWALQVAQWFWLKKGLKTRWYLGDGGGETIRQVLKAFQGEEFIDIWEYPLWKHPFETTAKMMEGGWPLRPLDPTSPILMPANWSEMQTKYGLFVYEGLTAMADYMMGDTEGGLADRMAKGQSLNNDDSFKFTDGSMKFGGNSRTHYGMVQRRIPHMLRENSRVPLFKIWTAHEQRAEDGISKETVIGPDIVGRMLTAKIMGSFGHTVHLCKVAKLVKEKDPQSARMIDVPVAERRAYTESHYDPNGTNFVKYLANVRIPEGCPEKTIPLYYAPPEPLKFYADLEVAQKLATESKTALIANVELTF